MKRVLCLGAGLVARPYVEYLTKHGFHVIVASRTLHKAQRLISGCENAEAQQFDIEKDDDLLEELTKSVDLVCSLLPYTYHVKAAKVAIRHGKHFCTTSYISTEMMKLDESAKAAEVALLNECGVDPGIDHMSAKRIIDDIHRRDGRIVKFTSFTGGLPAPEANTNPWGYKLSWSPRGVLLAGRNDAHFLRDGKEVKIPGRELFASCEIMEIPGVGVFEGYPNRDSMSYIEIYGIPEVQTILRGTLRNVGWCSTLKSVVDLGLLGLEPQNLEGMTYREMMRRLVQSQDENVESAVARKLGIPEEDPIIKRLEWIGLFDDRPIPAGTGTYLDALCHLFEEKLQYEPNERDMIVMHHEFVADFGDHQERTTSTLVDYGIPGGDSSMSRTVALPVAIASRMILEGTVTLTGVLRPVMPELYNPILDELESLGIRFTERTEQI